MIRGPQSSPVTVGRRGGDTDCEFYWISGSPYAWRVQLALEYKGVPYTSRRLDTARQEHRSPTFLALNPRGKVPVLRIGDTIVCESVAILAFIDGIQPALPLFGRNAHESGRIWQRISEFENYLRDTIDQAIVRPLLREDALANAGSICAANDRVMGELQIFNGILAGSGFLAGGAISAADIVALPHLQLLRRIGARPAAIAMGLGLDNLDTAMPALNAWRIRMEGMHGYDASYPPHWRTAA